MSVIDDLKAMEDKVAKRMEELRPLVDEYRELEQVAQRLGVTPANGADTSARPRRATRRRRAAGTSTQRTAAATVPADATAADKGARNGRREQLLSMVNAHPGITVREVGAQLGVDPTSLYRIVHRLEKEGRLHKRGRELLPS